MRDSLCNMLVLQKSIEYKTEYIKKRILKIEQLESDLRKNIQTIASVTNEECISNTKKTAANYYSILLTTKYSRGDEIATLEHEVHQLYDILTSIELENYSQFMFCEAISLGVLFEIDKSKIERLVKAIDDYKIESPLLDKLCLLAGYRRAVTFKEKDKRKQKNMIDKEDKFLIDAIDSMLLDKVDITKVFCDYTSKQWFKDLYGRDYKKAHTEPGYFGLWNFSGAAVSKLLDIDDSALKDDNHYPYELRHYKNNYRFNVDIVESDRLVKPEEPPQITYNLGIPSHRKLEKVVPLPFHEKTETLLQDYKNLEPMAFYKKYELENTWFDEDSYLKYRENEDFLGVVVIHALGDFGYITSIDWKDPLDIDDVENYWGDTPVKLVHFDLNNDEYNYAYIPKKTRLKSILGAKILDAEDLDTE